MMRPIIINNPEDTEILMKSKSGMILLMMKKSTTVSKTQAIHEEIGRLITNRLKINNTTMIVAFQSQRMTILLTNKSLTKAQLWPKEKQRRVII